MKIINPKRSTVRISKVGIPAMYIYNKRSSCIINKEAVDMLKLKNGDRIILGQSDSDDTLFYIFKDKKNGFKVSKRNTCQQFEVASTEFKRLILQTFITDLTKVVLAISKSKIIVDGIEAYPMIRISEEME